jgi:hypothetical protein
MSEITNSVERLRKVINGMDFVPLMKQDILVVCDAAAAGDKAGYERGVRESAEKAVSKLLEQGFSASMRGAVQQASLSLLAPPVWQHKPDCPTPYQWDEREGWWKSGHNTQPSPRAKYCDGCGEPMPETKGS